MLTMLDKDKHAKNGKKTMKTIIIYTLLKITFHTDIDIILYSYAYRYNRDRYKETGGTGNGRRTERRISGV
jgi:hypothetical protein